MKKKHRTRKIVISTTFLIINILVVVLIARYFFADATSTEFSTVFMSWMDHWYFVLMALLCPIIAIFVEALKFYVMIGKKLKKHRLSVSIKTAIFGKYYDNVTPLGSGGQPFQIMYLYKYGISGPDSSLLPVTSFIMNQFAFITLALVAFITGGYLVTSTALKISAYIGSIFMIAMPLIVLFFTVFPVISRKLSVGILKMLHKIKMIKSVDQRIQKIDYFIVRFKTSFQLMSQSKRIMITSFLLSLVYQIAMYSIPFFVILSLGIPVNYFEILALCVFLYAAVAYIPTPGNSGGMEISFAILFSMLVYYEVFWSMLLWRFASYFLILIIGLVALLVDFIHQRRHPFEIPEKERHRVVYPLATLENTKNLIFPNIEKGEL